jgi:hypothetical protein
MWKRRDRVGLERLTAVAVLEKDRQWTIAWLRTFYEQTKCCTRVRTMHTTERQYHGF